jgi:hypothetical protein
LYYSISFAAFYQLATLTGCDFQGPDLLMLSGLELLGKPLDLFGVGSAAAPTAFFAFSE